MFNPAIEFPKKTLKQLAYFKSMGLEGQLVPHYVYTLARTTPNEQSFGPDYIEAAKDRINCT
nr:Phage integrase [Moritella viscosa]SHO15617.1 Phage integrase [Moritella viscosa]SHO19064.1 Phage integrase [Moritella viscosa]